MRRDSYKCSMRIEDSKLPEYCCIPPMCRMAISPFGKRGRLDLTVEALILDEKWKSLFSEQEREIAWRRLTEYNYKF